jgi:hypothetical protein
MSVNINYIALPVHFNQRDLWKTVTNAVIKIFQEQVAQPGFIVGLVFIRDKKYSVLFNLFDLVQSIHGVLNLQFKNITCLWVQHQFADFFGFVFVRYCNHNKNCSDQTQARKMPYRYFGVRFDIVVRKPKAGRHIAKLQNLAAVAANRSPGFVQREHRYPKDVRVPLVNRYMDTIGGAAIGARLKKHLGC